MCFMRIAEIPDAKNAILAPSHKFVGLGLVTAEICWRVWGTPADFNGFRVLAALLHGTLVVGVNQILRRWMEDANYIWQGDHDVGHWPAF